MSLDIIKSSPERSISLASIFTKKNMHCKSQEDTVKASRMILSRPYQPKCKTKSCYKIPNFKGFNFITKHDTLESAFKYIKDQIIIRTSQKITSDLSFTDQELLQKFQTKFMLIEEEWTSMMNMMHQVVCDLDKQYGSSQYFGFKNAIYYHILNISLSFILLGPNTIIDNVVADKVKLFYNDDKNLGDGITLSKILNFFWIETPIVMSKISDYHNQIISLDMEHTKMLHYASTLKSNIQTLRHKIKQQTRELIINKEDQILSSQNKNDIICLKQILFQQDYYETKIKNIILEKQKILEEIKSEFSNLSNFICFSYFTHDDWSPSLDNGLLPER